MADDDKEFGILDAILVHSILFESYKLGVEKKAIEFAAIAERLLIEEINKLSVSSLADLRKMQFNAFNRRLNEKMMTALGAFLGEFEKELAAFAAVETRLTGAIANEYLTREQTKSLFGVALFTDVDVDAILKVIKAQIIAATGLLWADMLSQSQLGLTSLLSRKVKRNRADALSVQDLAQTVTRKDVPTGNAPYSDNVKNDLKTLVATLLHHAHSVIYAGIFSIFASRYEWLSILDSRTTDVCRGRDGKTYTFGKGPIPPAHYNCRSRIAPVSITMLDGFPQLALNKWLGAQDPKFLDAAFGKARAKQIMSGEINLDKITDILDNRTLSLTDYENLSRAFTLKG